MYYEWHEINDCLKKITVEIISETPVNIKLKGK